MTSYAHEYVFLYLRAQTCIKTLIYLSHLNSEKKTELNELEYLKRPLQMSSYAHWRAFLYLHAQTYINTCINLSHLTAEEKTELNELE